ncbi:glycosyltransferase [Paenarthrobacter sp. NPDC058040]|uniref:glycosyltransferase n=1 Tax=unclassified Paenarthrobacter TaxID=2634190 RepID=UPI0036DEA7FC
MTDRCGQQTMGRQQGVGHDRCVPGNMPGPAAIRHVAVVVPAHNEEQHLGRAVASLRHAVDVLQRHLPGVAASVTVMLDSCTDGSARIAAAFTAADPRFSVVEVRLRSTGASRAIGIATALEQAPLERETVWLANTDADSTVPASWLLRQMELANKGADAILGTVEPDPGDVDPNILRRWRELHPFHEDHPHIYGANFGVRASAYLQAGGFPAVRAHEDRLLAERLRRLGHNVLATDSIRVITSGRTHARAPQGFAAYLRSLAHDVPVVAEPA